MKKILYLLFVVTITNIQGIMAQEKITQTAGADGKAATKGGGQMLVCVAGKGWYQEWGKPAVQMLPGDVVHIPANVKHWHGAAADSWFAHLAFEVPGENTSNEWLEPVTDEYYNKLE